MNPALSFVGCLFAVGWCTYVIIIILNILSPLDCKFRDLAVWCLGQRWVSDRLQISSVHPSPGPGPPFLPEVTLARAGETGGEIPCWV